MKGYRETSWGSRSSKHPHLRACIILVLYFKKIFFLVPMLLSIYASFLPSFHFPPSSLLPPAPAIFPHTVSRLLTSSFFEVF